MTVISVTNTLTSLKSGMKISTYALCMYLINQFRYDEVLVLNHQKNGLKNCPRFKGVFKIINHLFSHLLVTKAFHVTGSLEGLKIFAGI